jgi:hypothetical protein
MRFGLRHPVTLTSLGDDIEHAPDLESCRACRDRAYLRVTSIVPKHEGLPHEV